MTVAGSGSERNVLSSVDAYVIFARLRLFTYRIRKLTENLI